MRKCSIICKIFYKGGKTMKNKLLLLSVCVMLLTAGCGTTNQPQTETSNADNDNKVENVSGEVASPEKTTQIPNENENKDESLSASEKFTDGQYKVGIDIPAGEYFLQSSGSAYFCVSTDANADNIIINDNFSNNSIITISDGQYLELVRCSAIAFEKVPQNIFEGKTISDGMYKVGYHIPAGEYKVTSNGNGYYCVYPNSLQQDIITNDNFTGSKYVSVSDGQYLELVRCTLVTE